MNCQYCDRATIFCSQCDHSSSYSYYYPRHHEHYLKEGGYYEFWVVDDEKFICYKCISKTKIKHYKRPFWKLPVDTKITYNQREFGENWNLSKESWEQSWIEHYNNMSDFEQSFKQNVEDYRVYNELKSLGIFDKTFHQLDPHELQRRLLDCGPSYCPSEKEIPEHAREIKLFPVCRSEWDKTITFEHEAPKIFNGSPKHIDCHAMFAFKNGEKVLAYGKTKTGNHVEGWFTLPCYFLYGECCGGLWIGSKLTVTVEGDIDELVIYITD